MVYQKNATKGSSFTRRDFIKTSALVGGTTLLASQMPSFITKALGHEGSALKEIGPYELARAGNVIYSTCLQCHVDCPIKAKVWNGTLAKITGSPYSPQSYLPHIPYDTSPKDAAVIDGKLCVKGQSAIQTYYDPYRVRKVLKREGPRGSNKWKSIPFSRFIDEVTRGGRLFADIGDERHYPGLDEVIALRDPRLSAQMARDAGKVAKGELSKRAFRRKYKDIINTLIDPKHPDLGAKNNGFVFLAGRIEHGRKELMKRFTKKSCGSPNCFEHTTICEQSHHIAYSEMTGHKAHHMKPDLPNCEFVLFWGTGAFSANFGLTPMAEKVTSGKVYRGMKTAVVDPRLSNDAGKADWWLPIEAGTDTALALAMIRWIMENERYDARYLRNANHAAAKADGESTWTNSAYLVKMVDGRPRELLRADEAGIGTKDLFVVSRNGQFVAVNPDDSDNEVEGDLFVSASAGGRPVKSAFQLLREEAFSRSMKEYSDITGIAVRQIVEVAKELTSHGKRAAVELYRGPVQHTDGYYAGCAIITLNLLIGNPDWKGGLSKGGGHWHESGGKKASRYNLKKMHPGGLTTWGPPITREKFRYEDTTLFKEEGYPAKRPWYPFTGNVYQEVIPSFGQGYPYKPQILFLHKGTPVFSCPAGHRQIDILRDPNKVPLFIACDIVIGETSMYADYILPDLTFLERWGTPHVTPDIPTKTSKIRQPVVKPLTEEVNVDGYKMPISMEAFLIAVSKRLGLSGFGKDAFNSGMDFNHPDDWYLKAAANLAFGDKPGEQVPEASRNEEDIFRKARRHLPESVYDEKRWRNTLRPDEWKKVIYVLNRGGRYAFYKKAYNGNFMKKKMGGMFHIFVERVARQKNSMSGEYFSGIPPYRGQRDSSGKRIPMHRGYPFSLITFKEPFSGQSRTVSNYFGQLSLLPENKIWINRADAERLHISPGDRVRILSVYNPEGKVVLGNGRVVEVVGEVYVLEGIRPRTIAASWHYGHWAYGSNDVSIDGFVVKGDRRRSKGVCPNPVMAVDPILKDVCLTDPIGGSSSFYDTRVDIEKV